jgi:hypothetical protein
MPIQAHGMNHFITSRAYSDCSRTYVWCSTENTVSLYYNLFNLYVAMFDNENVVTDEVKLINK